MDKIPYFDAHCDTISRCVETGEDFTGEDREFYAVPCSLRRSEGHIDLERTERAFRATRSFSRSTATGAGLTQRQLLTACARQHERFLREMEENKDRIRLCRTGEEIDRAAADGVARGAAEHRGRGAARLRPRTRCAGSAMGRADHQSRLEPDERALPGRIWRIPTAG